MKRKIACIFFILWTIQTVWAGAQADRHGLSVIVVATAEEAQSLRDQIRGGAPFGLMAMRHSIGSTAADAGYLGSFRAADLRPELRESLEDLRPGEVSKVTKVGGAYFLLRWLTPQAEAWRALYEKGNQALRQGHESEAVQAFADAVGRAKTFGHEDQRTARSLQRLSQAYRMQRNFGEAEAPARQSAVILEKLLGPDHPAVVTSLENLASLDQGRGDFAEAVSLYERILSIRWRTPSASRHPNGAAIWDQLARVLSQGYVRDGELEAEARALEEGIARVPLRREAYAVIGDSLLKVGLPRVAESVMLQSLRMYPTSREVRFALGEMYMKASRFEKATEAFKEASRLDGTADSDEDRRQRSLIFERIGEMNALLFRFPEARTAFGQSLRLDPENGRARVALGRLYLRRGMLHEAEESYAHAIDLDKGNAEAYQGLADLNLQRGRLLEAGEFASKALELNPDDRSSLYIRAVALLRLGQSDRGRAVLEEYNRREAEAFRLERLQREIAELRRSAIAKLVTGSQEEGLALLRRALSLGPDVNEARSLYLSLGVAQAKIGRHGDAVKTLEVLIRSGLDDFLAHWILAREYALLKDSRHLRQRAVSLQKYDAALQSRVP